MSSSSFSGFSEAIQASGYWSKIAARLGAYSRIQALGIALVSPASKWSRSLSDYAGRAGGETAGFWFYAQQSAK